MNTPIVTSLVVDPSPTRPKPTPPWEAPFLELLGVLKIIDNSLPTPRANGQRFCFQPSHDLSEISKVFLSVSSSFARYDIDLKTIRILGSDAVPPSVNKLQEYANHVLRRIRLFRDRLLERAVINDSTCFRHVDLLTCPLCRDPLVNCFDCDSKVACAKPICPGSLVIDCEFCYEDRRMACHACLAKNDTVPPLICCPICQGWSCREDIDWCAGLIVQPTLGTEELAELSRECEWDSETIVRSHLPKPAPCRFCTDWELAPGWVKCSNSVNDLKPDRCPSQTPFMTQIHLRAAYCSECVDQSPGRRCACEVVWICDMCSVVGNKTIVYPHLITCPRCGKAYCNGPEPSCGDYIEFCKGCKGVILCEDCQEEEALPGGVQTENEPPKQVVLTVRCKYCECWGCGECQASERTATCSFCLGWFCHSCINNPFGCDLIQRCPICNEFVCIDCRVDHKSCRGARMLNNKPPPYSHVC
ncbi:hypothetical protein J3R82DRAFT_7309 [Butyriboletus roseoflavus]|nr:hypothetical protein J3R82DRAFT_7309 [Butyriboletus roseoflavus]